jgi:tRNA nucleotidyltransferase (CCA-adding enzyme)
MVRGLSRWRSNVASARRGRDDSPVRHDDPDRLLDRFAALPAAQPLLQRLKGWTGDVYLVGGAVRDLMLGKQPVDLDLMVPGPVDAIVEQLGAGLLSHDRFGTAGGEMDGHRYDLAQSRKETYSHSGALPEVGPGDVEADLSRRDFTVNAIALAVLGPSRGRLIAFGTALADLDQGLLRVLHERSFEDDPTRLLRLARYAARLDFSVEDHTLELAHAALAERALDQVSGGRIGTELRLLAAEADPVAGLANLAQLGLDQALAPGFGVTDPGVITRGLGLLPGDGSRPALVLGAAVLALGAAQRATLLGALAFPADERDRILEASTAPELSHRLSRARKPSEIAAAVGTRGPEAVALAGALGAEDPARVWLQQLRRVGLQISGTDLLAAGIGPGPAVGRGLAAALAARLDGEAETAEAQLAVALEAAREPRGEGN